MTTARLHDDRALLDRLERQLADLEAAHDFEVGEPGPEIEELIERIAEISNRLDGPVLPVPQPDLRSIERMIDRLEPSPTRALPESLARSERRRTQRAAERRRRAERKRIVRRCMCGCGEKIPPEADPRRKFIDRHHRDAFHNRRRGTR